MLPLRPVFLSNETLDRRSWLDWLGRAAVLSLTGRFLAACTPSNRALAGPDIGLAPDGNAADQGRDDSDAIQDHNGKDIRHEISDGRVPDTVGDGARTSDELHRRETADAVASDEMAANPFPFEPGQGLADVFAQWGERTVDPQDLEWIIRHWTLRVDGLVEQPLTFTFAELLQLTRQDQVTDFHCVEGWSILDVPWNGVHLSKIFERVRPLASATHLTFHTIGGRYNESLPLAVALQPRTLLAYGIDDHTLPFKHGFPLRIVIPRLLGYKNAKYVERLELDDKPVRGFWVQAGYPYDGGVDPARLRPGKY